jgi:hypothetical protein
LIEAAMAGLVPAICIFGFEFQTARRVVIASEAMTKKTHVNVPAA